MSFSSGRKNAGTYKVTVTLTGNYSGSKAAAFTINKATNPLKVKVKAVKVKYSAVKKKDVKFPSAKVFTFIKKGQGKISYNLVSVKKGNKKIKNMIAINKTTGKVTIKKNTKMKKGTYKVKVKVKAAGNANYKASAVKTVTFKVKVK